MHAVVLITAYNITHIFILTHGLISYFKYNSSKLWFPFPKLNLVAIQAMLPGMDELLVSNKMTRVYEVTTLYVLCSNSPFHPFVVSKVN